MDEHDDVPHAAALYAVFEEVLEARPQPGLPGVVDAAVAGGRRIRRRRAALAAAGTLAVVACTVSLAGVLSAAGSGRAPRPVAPAATAPATPGLRTTAPQDPLHPGAARSAESPATGAASSDTAGAAQPAHTGAHTTDDR